jgi:starch phosphorylase
VLPDFARLDPALVTNVTNGVTPRRFVALANPRLTKLVTQRLGDGWVKDFSLIRDLERYADDADFLARWREVKRDNKVALAKIVLDRTGVVVDPASLFDVQVKRIHEYKRQHLNLLHVVALYRRMKREPGRDWTPRTVIFGGKAAPGYRMAKLIIRLAHAIADVVNHDPDVAGRLKVVFIPDFNVKVGQHIYPAADLSEQISTAGKEASGTGNMKFAMNGALTIGTLDGANVEIREAVGAENFYLFGLTAEEVQRKKADGYNPWEHVRATPELGEALELVGWGHFSPQDPGLFRPLIDSIIQRDDYMICADFKGYVEAQDAAARTYRDPDEWARRSVLNAARMGHFSSDRSIAEYAKHIWKVEPVNVELPPDEA